MDIRSLSCKQLKDLRKSLRRSNRRFFFFQRNLNPCQGVPLSDVNDEITRRKIQNLRMGKQ